MSAILPMEGKPIGTTFIKTVKIRVENGKKLLQVQTEDGKEYVLSEKDLQTQIAYAEKLGGKSTLGSGKNQVLGASDSAPFPGARQGKKRARKPKKSAGGSVKKRHKVV